MFLWTRNLYYYDARFRKQQCVRCCRTINKMNFKITLTASPKPYMGGWIVPINTTADLCAPTLTTRYDAIDAAALISMSHYPRMAVMYLYD